MNAPVSPPTFRSNRTTAVETAVPAADIHETHFATGSAAAADEVATAEVDAAPEPTMELAVEPAAEPAAEPVLEQIGTADVPAVYHEAALEGRAMAPTSILVASLNNGLNQMVTVAMKAEEGAKVSTLKVSISALADMGANFVNEHDVVVFAADPASDDEMAALNKITAQRGERTRFLAMTSDALTLADARALMAAGVDEVLPLASIRPELRHAVDLQPEVQAAEDRRARTGRAAERFGDVITVAKACGGIGATTLAVNLAAALAAPEGKKGKAAQPANRVALIDLDFQHGNAGFFLDVEDQGAFFSLAREGSEPDATFLSTAMIEHSPGLDVLPAPAQFAPLTALSPDMIAALLSTLRAEYDFVIVDLPSALVDWLAPVLEVSSRMLMVSDTSVPAIRQARRLMDFYLDENPRLEIDIVVNQQKKPLTLSGAQREAQNVLDRPLAHWVARDDRAARAAADSGKPVVHTAKRSPIARAINRLAQTLVAARADAAQADKFAQ